MNEIWRKYKKKFFILGILRIIMFYCFAAFMISEMILITKDIEQNTFIILSTFLLFFLLLLTIFGFWYRWIFYKIFQTKNQHCVPKKYDWFFQNNIKLLLLWFLQLVPFIDIFFIINFYNNMQKINVNHSKVKEIL